MNKTQMRYWFLLAIVGLVAIVISSDNAFGQSSTPLPIV
jgi:hypothetical protein